MPVFGDYARYYNLLYQDKNYVAETDFILSVLAAGGCSPCTILDLGCGTGRHALEMARRNIAVEGVDLSETMLSVGKSAMEAHKKTIPGPCPILHCADARSVRLDRKFDAVTSLFHVMSYQTDEQDALAVLDTSFAHLHPGGLFLFDFWFGPCVLSVRPEPRVKNLENDAMRVDRTATPTMDLTRDLVTVHYDVKFYDQRTGEESSFSEDHHMRYWFLPELRFLAKQAGFLPLAEGGWMKTESPTDKDWGAWLLLQKESR